MPAATAHLLAFVLCDNIIEDVETGKKTLVGLFDLVVSVQAPAYVPELAVYICLTGGPAQSPTAVRLYCVDPDGHVLAEATEQVEFRHEHSMAELVFKFQGFEFRRPGWYRFVCELNGEPVAERGFRVELESS